MICFQGLCSVSVLGVATSASPAPTGFGFSTDQRRDATDGTSEQRRKMSQSRWSYSFFFQQTLLIILISWSNESLLLQIVSFV